MNSNLTETPLSSGSPSGDSEGYSDSIIKWVENIYILAIVIWVLLIIALDLYHTDFIGGFILFIPILVFLVSRFLFKSCDTLIENEIFQFDILAFGYIIVAVFMAIRYVEYSNFFYKLLFVGILFVGLSMIDIWINTKYIIIIKHIKEIFQTFAITLFIYVFYSFYYISSNSNGSEIKNPFKEKKFH